MGVQHIVNVSGGKDSTAVYLRAIESGRPFRAVFADTGNEHPATLEFIAGLPAAAGGPPIETVRADFSEALARHRAYILEKWPAQGIAAAVVERAAALNVPTGNPFLDLCLLKGRFPSTMAAFCTSELKVLPITEQVILPALRSGPVLQWLGIRAEESARRARQPRFNRDDSGSYLWRPIFGYSLADVWAIHRRHGVARNPLYDAGMGRVGCMPCINCRKGELRLIAELYPEQIARIELWESMVRAAAKRGMTTFFPAKKDSTDSDTPDVYSGVRKVVEWSRTARGGRQFDLLQAGGGCASDWAVCEVEAA